MKQEFKWAEALRISPQQLMEWQDIAPANVPLQFWCIQQGHITGSDYLEWAIDFFQLPVLQDEFFEEHPLLEKKPAGEWHPWFNPVAEWDGVLFVACVEPPPPRKWSQPVQFLLASPKAMQKAWSAKKSHDQPVLPDKTLVIDIPDGLTVTNIKKKSLLQLDDNPTTVTSVTKLTNSGVDLELTSSKSQIRIKVPPTKDAPPPKAPSVPPPSMPLTLEVKTPSKPVVVAKPAPAPAAKIVPAVPEPPVEHHELTKTSVTQVTKSLPPLKAGKSKLPPAPVNLDDAETPDQAFAWAFAQVTEHYTHAMALQESNGIMIPLFWTPNWKAPKDTQSRATSLDQPSLFRIAGKTRRPYHGFVVASEIHKEFFKSWGFDALPACATAIPIVVREHVWGLILSIGEESAQGPEALKIAELTGEKISQFLAAQIAAA